MILVTGGTGLLGSRLLFDLAKADKPIRALKRKSSTMNIIHTVFKNEKKLLDQIQWVDADITDIIAIEKAMTGITQVYHCAGLVSFDPGDAQNLIKINRDGTTVMVNASLNAGVQKFCHVSSVAALGRSENENTITEYSTWKNSKYNSNYAVSKYAAELEVWRGIEEGLDAVIVNPSIIIGPGDWTAGSSQLFGQVWKGLLFYTEGVTGYVDAGDVSDCMIQLMKSTVSNERFIINAENLSFREVLTLVANGLGKKTPSIKVTKLMAEIAWRIESLRSLITRKKPLVTHETARNSRCSWYYSNEKIKTVLKKEFTPISKSIENTCRLFIENNS